MNKAQSSRTMGNITPLLVQATSSDVQAISNGNFNVKDTAGKEIKLKTRVMNKCGPEEFNCDQVRLYTSAYIHEVLNILPSVDRPCREVFYQRALRSFQEGLQPIEFQQYVQKQDIQTFDAISECISTYQQSSTMMEKTDNEEIGWIQVANKKRCANQVKNNLTSR